jgi:simple sugar transport system permease protein
MQALQVPIPYELLLMMPYVLTLLAFILFVHRSRPPAALGKPYPESQD